MEPIVGDGQMNAGARVARLWEHLVALLQVRLRQAQGDAKAAARDLVMGIVFALVALVLVLLTLPLLVTAAILALVGAINIPIIKFSVDWWNTLHQPASIIRLGGPTIDPSMLWPLLVMASAFTLLFVLLHLIAMRAEIYRRRVRTLQLTQVERAALVEA